MFECMLSFAHSPIHSDPAVLGGTIVFRGTRVPAQSLLDYLSDGDTLEAFLEMFPTVQRVDADAFLVLVRI